MSKLCPSCFTFAARIHPQLGLLPCDGCQARQSSLPSPRQSVEVVPERIKAERQERGDSIEQPHLKGELNKKWVELWGEDAAKERGFSEKEIQNAKYVMDGVRSKNTALRYYKDAN